MMDWMSLANLCMGAAGLALTSLGLILAIVCRPVAHWTRSYFIVTFALMIVCTAAITADYAALLFHCGGLIKPMIFVESLSASLLMPLLTAYLLGLCREKWRESPLFFAVAGLWTVFFGLLVYTQFSTAIYSLDAEGVYSRGPLYPLLLVSPALIMLLNLLGLLRRRDKLTVRQRRALFVYILAPLAAIVLQMLFYGLLLVAFGAIIGAYVMFVSILSEQTAIAVRRTRESAEKEFGLKVLQMRPHFIYNAMTSIYYLVDTDPEAAKSAIRDFSRYLHQNFSAVVRTENVPFEEELAHTQAYLAIEKTRFGDRLDVACDLADTVFSLPPLTLEPIVENAVKHGMDPDLETMHILIRTRAVENGHEVTVINDGAALELAESDGEGVGLKNVSDRLAQMCGGSLSITPRDGGGAVVTMRIPKG